MRGEKVSIKDKNMYAIDTFFFNKLAAYSIEFLFLSTGTYLHGSITFSRIRYMSFLQRIRHGYTKWHCSCFLPRLTFPEVCVMSLLETY